MSPEINVLELLMEVHEQLFEGSLNNDVPTQFLMKFREELKNVHRHINIAIRVINTIIEEDQIVQGRIDVMQTRFSDFFNDINKKKKGLKKEISDLHKNIEQTHEKIKDEEKSSKYVIESINMVMRDVKKMTHELKDKHMEKQFSYALNLDAPVQELGHASQMMKHVWEMEKQLENEETTLDELLESLQKKGVKESHPVFDKNKETRLILEDIAKMVHILESKSF